MPTSHYQHLLSPSFVCNYGERGKVSAANQTRLGGQWNVLVDVRLDHIWCWRPLVSNTPSRSRQR